MKEVYKVFLALKIHSNWSFLELYNLPVALRFWFIEELIEQRKRESEAQGNN